jgi:hypothetical protein
VRGEHLSFACLALLSAAAPLRDLEALEASYLVQDTVRELPFWRIVAPVVYSIVQ